MAYDLFLFDADDTLFDFKAAEQQALTSVLATFGIHANIESVLETYKLENEKLWRLLENNGITKDELKIKRFEVAFKKHGIEIDPERASETYLEALSEADHLIDHAFEICQFLSEMGEIGIVTNGIVTVQKRRLDKASLRSFVSFIAVSEECGFAKPDDRFFKYSVALARRYSKVSTLVIGDRLETDIAGAHNFGLDACWFNPNRKANKTGIIPKYEIGHLSELRNIALQ